MFSIICKKSHFPKLAPAPPPRAARPAGLRNDEPSGSASRSRGRSHAPTEPRTAAAECRVPHPAAPEPAGTEPPLRAAPPMLPPALTPPRVRSSHQRTALAAAAAGAAPELCCARCGAAVPASNAALHELHCQKQRTSALACEPASLAAMPTGTSDARPRAAALDTYEIGRSHRNAPDEADGISAATTGSRPASVRAGGDPRSVLESAGSASSFFAADEELGGEFDSAKSLLDRMRSFLHAAEQSADPYGAAARQRREDAAKSALAPPPRSARSGDAVRELQVPADADERARARAVRSGGRERNDTSKRMAQTMGSETRAPAAVEPVAKPPVGTRNPLPCACARAPSALPKATVRALALMAAGEDGWGWRREAPACREAPVRCANGKP